MDYTLIPLSSRLCFELSPAVFALAEACLYKLSLSSNSSTIFPPPPLGFGDGAGFGPGERPGFGAGEGGFCGDGKLLGAGAGAG